MYLPPFTIINFSSETWQIIHRLGGPGLILLGLIDNSFVPVPGSMDIFLIVLTTHNRQWWLYYALMATVGAVSGGYLTYRMAEKGGEEVFEKKLGKTRVENVYKRFEQRGFWTVCLAVMIPPPFPAVPFLMAAGILHYPRSKFLAAAAVGRSVRFLSLAFLAKTLGGRIVSQFNQYSRPFLYAFIALSVAAACATLMYFLWYRRKGQKTKRVPAS
jgi:membrane protein YqaA with SNARE-associated domain